MTTKRGVSADLFLWMFATIAGALLLFFFIRFSSQHANTATTVEDIELLRSFEQQLYALGVTDEVSKTLTLPGPASLQIVCQDFLTPKAREKTSLFLFGPSTLSGQQKYTLVARPWLYPFPVDTFYSLAPSTSLVLLVYEPSEAGFVEALDLPSSLPVKKLPSSSFSLNTIQQQLKGYSHVTLAFFGQAPDSTSFQRALGTTSFTLLQVDVDHSQITFYPKQDKHPFFGEAMLLGAVFGPTHYPCLQQRALERFKMLAELHQQKALLLLQKVGSGSSCAQQLSQGASILSSLSTPSDVSSFPSLVTSLTTVNQELERHACPTLF